MAAELAGDVEWDVVRSVAYRGREEAAGAVGGPPDRCLHIRDLLSHGKQVAAAGTTISATNELTHFAHVVSNSGHGKAAKIQSIVTYQIDGASPDR